jgi:hypothetical protein
MGVLEKSEENEQSLCLPDLENLKEEIEFEICEYAGQTNDEFVVLQDETIYRIMQVINQLIYGHHAIDKTKTPQDIIKEGV